MAEYAPGVYFNEIDNTLDSVTPAGPTTACFVIESRTGPINQRTLVRNSSQYIKKFGQLDPTLGLRAYRSQLSVLAALRGCDRVYVTRVVNGALYGGCMLIKDPQSNNILFNSLQPFGLPNVYDPNLELTDDVILGIYASTPGDQDIKIKLEPNTTTIDGGIWLSVYAPSDSTAPKKYNVSLTQRVNSMGEQMYVEDYINSRSADIVVRVNPRFDGVLDDSLVNVAKTAFVAGGSAGNPVTDSQVLEGYALYANVSAAPIDLYVNAGWENVTIKQALVSLAFQSKGIAIIDPPIDKEHDAELLADYRNNVLNIDSRFGYMVVPYVTVTDVANNKNMFAPPSGFVAAIMARSDRKAKWISPAGMDRGDLLLNQRQSAGSPLAVIGLRTQYDADQQLVFAQNQINPILNFNGIGLKLFGDNTLQTRQSMFQFLNVSRMFNYVIVTSQRACLFSAFDPNDDILRQKVKATLESILEPIKSSRGLVAFSVICDASNNPTETTSRGELHAYLSIVATPSARAVIIDGKLEKNAASFSIVG